MKARILPVWLVVLCAIAAAACSGGPATPAAGAAGGPPPAIAVVTASVVQKPMPVNVRAVGTVEAFSTVEVRAQVTGELQTVGFKEGQDVTAGQVLFTIDPRPFEVALRQAQATLTRDAAQLKNAEAQKARATDLLKSGLVPRAEFDNAVAAAEALTATVAADRAQAEAAALQLERTRVFAPVTGRTGALLVHAGSLIRANDAAPLVVINQIAPTYVSFAIPARLLPRLAMKPGAKGPRVEAAAPGDDATATGAVTFVDNTVDKTTDTIRLKATFDNTNRRLWPGAFVDVVLRLAVDERAIVVPAAAILPGQQGQYVYVVTPHGTVESRTVVVGWTDGADAIVQSGLKNGETVVVDGQLRLTPGARVNPKPAPPTKAGAPAP
jgi:multidrug efflux system membrane fusion protein